MIRRLVARGLLSVVLAAALFSLFRLPAGAATAYQEITGMEELTSGQYVLVTPLGDAPGILLGEDFVISTTKPTFTGDTVAAGAEWNLTVTECPPHPWKATETASPPGRMNGRFSGMANIFPFMAATEASR